MFTQCWAWIKLATDNFSTVLTRNLQNPRDHAPLNIVGGFLLITYKIAIAGVFLLMPSYQATKWILTELISI